jgi:hypothetical protein
MFDLIKLNFSPFSADSIAWSHDGELAVAGPDTLQLHVQFYPHSNVRVNG